MSQSMPFIFYLVWQNYCAMCVHLLPSVHNVMTLAYFLFNNLVDCNRGHSGKYGLTHLSFQIEQVKLAWHWQPRHTPTLKNHARISTRNFNSRRPVKTRSDSYCTLPQNLRLVINVKSPWNESRCGDSNNLTMFSLIFTSASKHDHLKSKTIYLDFLPARYKSSQLHGFLPNVKFRVGYRSISASHDAMTSYCACLAYLNGLFAITVYSSQ